MVTVKVFPTLRDYLPSEYPRTDKILLDLSRMGKGGVRVKDLVKFLGIPREKVSVVILNGIIRKDLDMALKDGDTVSLSPPIAGG
ncbi:MAG: MoaD/ThiS family protein [Deltaproteobacteria bacterium]|nr:MoaD/ThiS family protein [Deltaproteobacteria bacterium]MBW2016018.1 MoaD/ThiS family protein [Deltaproteobacteria bacterium]MBW2129017.1 MoaD/ThiS family protein [Deltaproteobacteria bacterium]MBW2304591.1 MoaD/ThiS family protein [Deltaproteobacteria bacterium]